jgi:hypothetical protein
LEWRQARDVAIHDEDIEAISQTISNLKERKKQQNSSLKFQKSDAANSVPLLINIPLVFPQHLSFIFHSITHHYK